MVPLKRRERCFVTWRTWWSQIMKPHSQKVITSWLLIGRWHFVTWLPVAYCSSSRRAIWTKRWSVNAFFLKHCCFTNFAVINTCAKMLLKPWQYWLMSWRSAFYSIVSPFLGRLFHLLLLLLSQTLWHRGKEQCAASKLERSSAFVRRSERFRARRVRTLVRDRATDRDRQGERKRGFSEMQNYSAGIDEKCTR